MAQKTDWTEQDSLNLDSTAVAVNEIANRMEAGALTKRERFAMAAMQGLLPIADKLKSDEPDSIAASSVKLADALIAELEKGEK